MLYGSVIIGFASQVATCFDKRSNSNLTSVWLQSEKISLVISDYKTLRQISVGQVQGTLRIIVQCLAQIQGKSSRSARKETGKFRT